MITRKTVVVVGAGASADVNLPLGGMLRDLVANRLSKRNSNDYQYFREAVARLLDTDGSELSSVLSNVSEHAKRIRLAASIDNYLDQHKNEEKLVLVAKLAIAWEIARAENKCLLSSPVCDEMIFKKSSDYFMLELLNVLIRGHQYDNFETSLSNITFVTFNYDRCLEWYFHCWAKFRFGSILGEIPEPKVIHVYGSLGGLFGSQALNPFEHNGDLFTSNPHLSMPQAAKNIKTFTEREESSVSKEIHEVISAADCVIFLGFGFEEQNMRFFNHRTADRAVFATVMGQSDPNIKHLSSLLKRRVGVRDSEEVFLHPGKCKSLFGEYYFPLTSSVGSLPN